MMRILAAAALVVALGAGAFAAEGAGNLSEQLTTPAQHHGHRGGHRRHNGRHNTGCDGNHHGRCPR